MSILALDLGTKTGWCCGTKGAHASGVWDLRPSRWQGGGMRFVKFRGALADLYNSTGFGRVYYEEVRRHRGTDAAHIYGGLMGHLTEWCETNAVPYEGVPVGSIKKFWTNKGNAPKEMMIAQAVAEGYATDSDDEADAIALFNMKCE
jgi:crossover junction endodeoxyribonuclease RuvC